MTAARHTSLVLLVALAAVSCRTTERYIVTTSAIDALGISQLTLCFAVEPNNPQGLWWWHPGRSGCSTRSSSVMQDSLARVTTHASAKIEASFQVPMQAGEPRRVELVFDAGTVRASATGASVRTEPRKALDMPEKP